MVPLPFPKDAPILRFLQHQPNAPFPIHIGGSLAKVVYFTRAANHKENPPNPPADPFHQGSSSQLTNGKLASLTRIKLEDPFRNKKTTTSPAPPQSP
ncbi:hypothetical protein PtB15_2B569 [Puccinia triticina]|nr:hypothetical protein PtB15_2B569 [Puccinia triticina]